MDGMRSKFFRLSCGPIWALLALWPLAFAGCGSTGAVAGNSGGSSNSDGTVGMMISDAPETDWAAVDVNIQSIALNPSGGGAPITVYTAPAGGTELNLVQLDQLNEILGNVSVPADSYVSATLTLNANPGDVVLIPSDNPDPGFAGASLPAGQAVPTAQVQIQGTTGSAGSLTVPLTITFVSPEVVTAGQFTAVDLEFDLSHPALIIAHYPQSGSVEFAVNFHGPVRHLPVHDVTRLVLRDVYGTVVSFNGTNDPNMVITRDFPAEPPVSPETPVTASTQLTISADTVNGTLFYDLDNSVTPTPVLMNFSSVAALLTSSTYYVRVAARYQADGSLVAARVWASTSFNAVWNNPEGHVFDVNTSTNRITVERENGHAITLQVVAATEFYFRTPADAIADSAPIGSGTGFLSNIKRGFKVHALVNPLTAPPQVLTVDIETARFDGKIVNPTTSSFGYTHIFANPNDSYTNFTLTYIPNTMANGYDPGANPAEALTGFKWWNFGFPTIQTNSYTAGSAAMAISDFVTTAGNSVNFGGAIGQVPVYGETGALWMSGTPGNWSAPYTILAPSGIPLGSVSAGWVSTATGGDFTMVAPPGASGGTPPVTPVTIDMTTTVGSATLVYQVARQANGIITVSPEDITTTQGLATVEAALTAGTIVNAYGVPELNGHLQCYVMFYFTGVIPVAVPAN